MQDLQGSNFDMNQYPEIEGSELDTELDKKNRFGAVQIYPKVYESDSAILENDSELINDVLNRKKYEEIHGGQELD